MRPSNLGANSATDLLVDKFCCPCCRSGLLSVEHQFVCSNAECQLLFPCTTNHIPILLNEKNSVFSIIDYLGGGQSEISVNSRFSRLKNFYRRYCIPSIGVSLNVASHLEEFAKLLLENNAEPVVLVIGGQTEGADFSVLQKFPAIRLVETDVGLGPRTQVICDAHDLPFKNASFDGVIAQAVLEHVLDPYRCVEEFHRVLKRKGLVYAETPFMQEVHLDRFDFTRFTYLGHRRLFRRFEEVRGGILCGPGMALAWSYTYFALSFVHSRLARAFVRLFCHWTSFFLKYFDPFLVNSKAAKDAASAFYLLAMKSDLVLSDRQLVKQYEGGSS